MRLICPNCEAQYEVPRDVIPDEGRDVQCSNCGNTWFQLHPDQEAAIAAQVAAEAEQKEPSTPRPSVRAVAMPEAAPEPERRPAPRADIVPEPSVAATVASGVGVAANTARPVPSARQPDDDGFDPRPPRDLPDPEAGIPEAGFVEIVDEDDEADLAPPPPLPPQRARKLDPRVMDVLRAEAEREAQVRATERGALESQPDLGLEDPETAAPARRRRATPSAAETVTPAPERAAAAEATLAATAAAVREETSPSRKDLLPDIEEINSTLRSASERRELETAQARAAEAEVEETRGGFGRGFRWAVLLVVVLAALYILAPTITTAVPATAPVLDPYVATINGLRVWLDGRLAMLTGADVPVN